MSINMYVVRWNTCQFFIHLLDGPVYCLCTDIDIYMSISVYLCARLCGCNRERESDTSISAISVHGYFHPRLRVWAKIYKKYVFAYVREDVHNVFTCVCLFVHICVVWEGVCKGVKLKVFVCVCVCVCTLIFICSCMCLCMLWVRACVRVYVCMCVFTHICRCVCMRLCARLFCLGASVCECVCVSVFVCVFLHTHIHICACVCARMIICVVCVRVCLCICRRDSDREEEREGDRESGYLRGRASEYQTERERERKQERVAVWVRVYTYICIYMRTYIQAYTYKYPYMLQTVQVYQNTPWRKYLCGDHPIRLEKHTWTQITHKCKYRCGDPPRRPSKYLQDVRKRPTTLSPPAYETLLLLPAPCVYLCMKINIWTYMNLYTEINICCQLLRLYLCHRRPVYIYICIYIYKNVNIYSST